MALTITLSGLKSAGAITLSLVILAMLVLRITAKTREENRTPKSKKLLPTELLRNDNSISHAGFLGALALMGGTTATEWPEEWTKKVAMVSFWALFAAIVWFVLIIIYRLTGWVGLKNIEGRNQKKR